MTPSRHPLLRTREATRTYITAILRHRTARRVHLTLRVQGRLW